jgi:hypothetical protein
MKTKETYLAGTGDEIWDFNTVWGINPTINDGYPYLLAFNKPQPQNQPQLAPIALTGIVPTSVANNDGKIVGTDATMEYRVSGSSTYTEVTSTQITGLVPATYYVRYKAKPGYDAGAETMVIVGTYTAPVNGNSSDSN